jgi:single-strand DNA-binding protein
VKDLNVFICTGRLTRDAELGYTNSGTEVANFSVAYSRSIKKGDQWEDKSCFIEAVIFGKRAEGISKYLTKGQQVTISGELDFDRWEDKDTGKARSKHRLVNVDIRLMGSKKDGGYTLHETGTAPEDDSIFNDGPPIDEY